MKQRCGRCADPAATALVLVARPDRVALMEAARTSEELRGAGADQSRAGHQRRVPGADAADPLAAAFERRGAQALASMPPALRTLPRSEIPLRGHNIVGLAALRSFLSIAPEELPAEATAETAVPPGIMDLHALVDELAAAGHGLVMVMGRAASERPRWPRPLRSRWPSAASPLT